MSRLKFFGKLACIVFALSIAFDGVCLAQSRRLAGVGSLLEMNCYGGDKWEGQIFQDNRDGIIINRKSYTAVGGFAFSPNINNEPVGVLSGKPIDVTCNLAGRNRSPRYKNLVMTVGMNEQSWAWGGKYAANVRLTVYLDGQRVSSEEVGFRELKRFSLNAEGVRNVSFSVECFNPSTKYSDKDSYCPVLWILEDKLY